MSKKEIEKVVAAVLTACEPDKMTPGEAIDFLEDVIDELSASLEALREENPEG